jgi:hypothetical protein
MPFIARIPFKGEQSFSLPLLSSADPTQAIEAQAATKNLIRKLAREIVDKGLENPECVKGRDLLSVLSELASERSD